MFFANEASQRGACLHRLRVRRRVAFIRVGLCCAGGAVAIGDTGTAIDTSNFTDTDSQVRDATVQGPSAFQLAFVAQYFQNVAFEYANGVFLSAFSRSLFDGVDAVGHTRAARYGGFLMLRDGSQVIKSKLFARVLTLVLLVVAARRPF